jgi:hypothetical protein
MRRRLTILAGLAIVIGIGLRPIPQQPGIDRFEPRDPWAGSTAADKLQALQLQALQGDGASDFLPASSLSVPSKVASLFRSESAGENENISLSSDAGPFGGSKRVTALPASVTRLRATVNRSNPQYSQDDVPVSTGLDNAGNATAPVETERASTRLREGREVREPQAVFQWMGERMNCVLPQHKTSVIVLENLALERVYELMSRQESVATWEIEGVVTEHQGRNYILLKRAVINSVDVDDQ